MKINGEPSKRGMKSSILSSLGILKSKAEADRKANNHSLPIAAFKMGGQRSPYLIHIEDLANHIDKLAEEARSTKARIYYT